MIPNWGYSHLRIGDNCSPLPFFLHYLSVLPQNAQVQVLDEDFITVFSYFVFCQFQFLVTSFQLTCRLSSKLWIFCTKVGS